MSSSANWLPGWPLGWTLGWTLGWPLVIALTLMAVPLVFVIGGIIAKLSWGFYPLIISLVSCCSAIWQLGIEWSWLSALGLCIGITLTWAWQRTQVFLKIDTWIEQRFGIDD